VCCPVDNLRLESIVHPINYPFRNCLHRSAITSVKL
jgi:hypothetical protein